MRLLGQYYESAAGEPLRPVPFFGTADARYFAGRAPSGLPEQVVYFGPRGGGIHAPDEYVELESVLLTARVLADVIVDWCT